MYKKKLLWYLWKGLLFNRLSSGTVKTKEKGLGNQCFLYNYKKKIVVSIYNSKYDGFTRHWNTIFMGTMMYNSSAVSLGNSGRFTSLIRAAGVILQVQRRNI